MIRRLICGICITAVTACGQLALPPAPACPHVEVNKVCHLNDPVRGLFDTHATEPGEYAIEADLGIVDPSRALLATGDLYQFWTTYMPFRVMWHAHAGDDWLPASDKVTAFPTTICAFL